MNTSASRVVADAMASVVAADPRDLATAMAALRVGIAAGALLAPAAFLRPLKGAEASADALTALRMAGGRDLAIGVGVLLAARRHSPALRSWLAAAAAADATDVYAFARDGAFPPLRRVAAALAAAGAVAASAWIAWRLRA